VRLLGGIWSGSWLRCSHLGSSRTCEGVVPPRSRNYFNTLFALSRLERRLDKAKRVRRRFGSGWGEGAGRHPGCVRPLEPSQAGHAYIPTEAATAPSRGSREPREQRAEGRGQATRPAPSGRPTKPDPSTSTEPRNPASSTSSASTQPGRHPDPSPRPDPKRLRIRFVLSRHLSRLDKTKRMLK